MSSPARQPLWWSQRVAAEGSTASEGIRRQLGKPRLDPLTVLIREAAQNSCDAAIDGHDVEFNVKISRLTGRALEGWRSFLLPEPQGSELGLAAAMAHQPRILTIADRGTTGLGGPLRADEPTLPGERADFVKFIRNVGERKGLDLGGGSYGFGKGILYNVSRCHVIVADSQCMFRGRMQRRLIGAAMGDGFEYDDVRYTGRHWLGVEDGDIAQALLDEEATAMADALALPKFAPGQTGTTVAIVDVDLGTNGQGGSVRTVEEAAEFLASTMLWNLWPRMITTSAAKLRCSVKFEGFSVDIPDPSTLIELKPFVDAYRRLSTPGAYEVPERKANPQEIGRFARVETMAPFKPNSLLAKAAPFSGPAHHCARMRQADLVVDYTAGDPHPDESLQYGAVFKASSDADEYFAEAEPPTHDDWVTNGLQGTALGVVRLANSSIRYGLRVSPVEPTKLVSTDASLAPLAGRLSGLLAPVAGDGAGTRQNGRARSGKRTRVDGRPRIISGPLLEVRDGSPVIVASVEFPRWANNKSVRAHPIVVIDGGVETHPTLEPPEILCWVCPKTCESRAGEEILVRRSDERIWEVVVRPPQDAVIRLAITTEENS